MNVNVGTIDKVKRICSHFGTEGVFGRTDIVELLGGSATTAGKLISKMKDAGLLILVSGLGKGKYRLNNFSK